MIQGLRLLPFYQEALDRHEIQLDCGTCMNALPATTRQHLGCGHLRPIAGARPWTPPHLAAKGVTATVCAGYACTLPEVREVVGCLPQWDQGTLTEYLDGEPPSRQLLDGLALLKGAVRELEAARIEASKRGGGR